jgi:hypothetical protein
VLAHAGLTSAHEPSWTSAATFSADAHWSVSLDFLQISVKPDWDPLACLGPALRCFWPEGAMILGPSDGFRKMAPLCAPLRAR